MKTKPWPFLAFVAVATVLWVMVARSGRPDPRASRAEVSAEDAPQAAEPMLGGASEVVPVRQPHRAKLPVGSFEVISAGNGAEAPGAPAVAAPMDSPEGELDEPSEEDPEPALVATEEARQAEHHAAVLATRLGDVEPERDFAPNAFNSRLLINLLESDSDDQVRTAAAYQLAGAPGPEARRALVSALSDPSTLVVTRAVQSLAQQSDPSLLPEIRAAVSGNADGQVKAALADAEAKLQGPQLVVRRPVPN